MTAMLLTVALLSVIGLILLFFANAGRERYRQEHPYSHQYRDTVKLHERRSRWPLTGEDDPRRFTYYWYMLPDGKWTFEQYHLDGTTETGPAFSREEFEQRIQPWIIVTEDGSLYSGVPNAVRYYPQSSVHDYLPHDRRNHS